MISGGDTRVEPRCSVPDACFGTKLSAVDGIEHDYRWPIAQSFIMSTGEFQTFGMFINNGEGISNQQILKLDIAGNGSLAVDPAFTTRFFADIDDNNGPDQYCSDAKAPQKYAGAKGWSAAAAWKKDCAEWFKDDRRMATAGLLREMRPDNYRGYSLKDLVPAFRAVALVSGQTPEYRDIVRGHIKNPDSLKRVMLSANLAEAAPEEIALAIFTPNIKSGAGGEGMDVAAFVEAVKRGVDATGDIDFAHLRMAAYLLLNGYYADAKPELDKIVVDDQDEPRKGPGSLDSAQRKLYAWLKSNLAPTQEGCESMNPTQDLAGEECADTNASCKRRQMLYDTKTQVCIETIQTCRNKKAANGAPVPLPYDEATKSCGAPCTAPEKVNAKGKCAKPASDYDEGGGEDYNPFG